MNRITREKIKKQREKSGFVGFKTGGKAGTTRGGLFSNLFKRKEIQPPTPSGVKPQTTKTKSEATKTQTETTVTQPQGRAEKMMENAAGNPDKPSTVVPTPEKDRIKKEIEKLQEQKSKASPRNKIAIQRKIDNLKAKL